MAGIDLKELGSLSKKLNEASDALSKQIAAFESALNELKLGVWAWVELARYQTDSPWVVDGKPESMTEVISLGYGKHKGKWGLLYSVTYPETGDNELDDFRPLRDAPRQERIDAVEHIPALLKRLESQVAALTRDATKKANDIAQLITVIESPQK